MAIRWFVASALCFATVQAEWWDSVTNIFGPGEQQEESGLSEYDRLQIVNAALESTSLNPNLRLLLLIERGNLYLDMGQFQEALNDFNNVIARKPEDKETLLEALAGQAKAQLALGKTDQYLATRTILIDNTPPGGYPESSDYYYLVTFPDGWGGPNWWRNPNWRGHFHDWLHDHHHHSENVVFSKNSVNVLQKPQIKTVPSKQPVRQQAPELERVNSGEGLKREENVERERRTIEQRQVERPLPPRPAPAARPSIPDRFDARPGRIGQ